MGSLGPLCCTPSMEGRTIARPDVVSAVLADVPARPSMEGRTIARPDCDLTGPRAGGHTPSMEGRTIARPDRGFRWNCLHGRCTFNGGPDNCPARLQFRRRRRAVGDEPSMEGRTIARPDWRGLPVGNPVPCVLQWRAGQLPGQTWCFVVVLAWTSSLQWRAGQLPGQTSLF